MHFALPKDLSLKAPLGIVELWGPKSLGIEKSNEKMSPVEECKQKLSEEMKIRVLKMHAWGKTFSYILYPFSESSKGPISNPRLSYADLDALGF